MKKAAPLFPLIILLSCSLFTSPANALADEWVEKASMPTGRYNFGAAVVNGTIYAIGGLTNIPERKSGHVTTTIDVNEAYDPINDVWVQKASMPSPHWLDSYAIAAYQNKIYSIGGPANNVYDPTRDSWEAKTPMPTSRKFLTANVVEDKIYLIGGLALGPAPAWQAALTNDSSSRLITYSSSNLNELYDPITDSWIVKTPIPVPVDSYASAVVGSKIYVIAGRVGGEVQRIVQVYDTETDSWSQGAPIPSPVQGAAAVAMTVANETAIYVVGGSLTSFGGNATNLNQIYFPKNDTWALGAPLLENRCNLCVTAVNDKLYAIGGFSISGFKANTYAYSPINLAEITSTTAIINETQSKPSPTTELTLIAITLLTSITSSAVVLQWKKKQKNITPQS